MNSRVVEGQKGLKVVTMQMWWFLVLVCSRCCSLFLAEQMLGLRVYFTWKQSILYILLQNCFRLSQRN